jgi:tetratricopeptide (TPR) repeat protein
MFRMPTAYFCELTRKAAVYLIVLCAGQIMAADTNTPDGYLENNFQRSHERFEKDTNNVVAGWDFGRACFDMSTLQKDPVREARFAELGIAACRAALARDPNSGPAHYYLGMDMGQLADTKRNLAALRMVKDMEREFLAARNLDEKFDNAGPDRNLGMLYRDAPVFASIGSRTKARQHLERAGELAPNFPENRLTLIEAYLKWDYRTEAARQLSELEKIWVEAQKKFTGVQWTLSWQDWNKRLENIKRKLEGNPRLNESPHSQ